MKKIALLLFFMVAFISNAQLSNGDFTSDANGWTAQNSSTISFSGVEGQPAGSLFVESASSTTSGAKANSFSVTNAGDYIVKFDVKGADKSKVQAQVWQSGPGTTTGLTYTLSGTDWQQVSTTIKGVLNTTNVSLRIISKTADADFYIDNVIFEEATTETTYVSNGDFENGLTDWTHNTTTDSGIGTVTGNGGGTVAALTFSQDQTAVTYFDNAVYDFGKDISTDNIEITFDAKSTNAAVEYQAVFKLFDDEDNNLGSLSTGTTTVAADGGWHSVYFNKPNTIIPFSKIQVRIKIKSGAVMNDVVAIDNVVSNLSYITLGLVEGPKQDLKVDVYPNPVNNILHISKEVAFVELYNILGQKTQSYSNTNSIDTSNLKSGSYIVKLISADGLSASKRVFKK